MTSRGFRKGRPGGQARANHAADGGEGFLSASLFSQAQILHLMKAEFARARRHGIELSCIMMQIDRLPQLVDLHGAELRQTVRQALADMVKSRTRGADLLGVMNDDRYLLLLPHTGLAAAHLVAERLRGLFAELEITVDGRALLLTLSLGVTTNESRDTMFFDSMVAKVEAALEHAAARGGNAVIRFEELHLHPAEPLAGRTTEPPAGPAGKE